MRWHIFVPFIIIAALAQFVIAPHVNLPIKGTAGEYLFLIAFFSAINCNQEMIVPTCFACGLTRDLILGNHLGASTILYMLAGLIVLTVRQKSLEKNWLTRSIAIFGIAAFILILRPILDMQRISGIHASTLFIASLSSALFTTLVSPAFELLLSIFQTWKTEKQNFGIPTRN